MQSSTSNSLAPVRERIYQAISAIRLIDPHTHINPHDAGSHTLADILGYHYYTELVHSAGMPRLEIEEPGISPRELVGRMVRGLGNITNTANYHWLIDICQTFFGFDDDTITLDNWEALYDSAEAAMASADWPKTVLDKSNVEAVFLTNDFDDDLQGFDSSTYIPCLRTDDLVFHLSKHEVRERLQGCSGVSLDGSLSSLRAALEQRFEHFVSSGARACAISIPPSFAPSMVSDGRAQTAWDHLLSQGTSLGDADRDAMSRRVFWTLAELCDQYGLPFDLMIGVNRQVYPGGVFQGQDLYDSRVSLIQYRELFNTFPDIKFPISVLASVTNQELVSYSWIFPNVLTNGHWWYSNTPSFIERDAAARLEAVPRNKQIAYYSDAYKLEFVLPKFDMYRRILAKILAEQFVGENGWSEEKAIDLGRQVLRGNVDEVFRSPLISDSADDVIAGVNSGAGTLQVSSATDPDSSVVEAAAGTQETVEANKLEPWAAHAALVSDSDPSAPAAADDPTQGDGDDVIIGELVADEAVEDTDDAILTPFLESAVDEDALDPVPTEAELEAVDVPDAELSESRLSVEETSLDAEIDPLPLDVGDILGEDGANPISPTASGSKIEMLTGDGEFTPDGDSMLLEPDPTTGELHFPIAQDKDKDKDDELA